MLPVKLLYFSHNGTENSSRIFKFGVDEASMLNQIVLEAGNGNGYQPVVTLYGPFSKNEMTIRATRSSFSHYRLKLTNHAGIVSYSQEIKLATPHTRAEFWPNPVKETISVKLTTVSKGVLSYRILNAMGGVVQKGGVEAAEGMQTLTIPTDQLDEGLHYLSLNGSVLFQTVSFKFVK